MRKRGRPKGAVEGALRRRIVDVAATEFARLGYNGARIETIARRSGCNRAMIYFYFKGKGELFEAALDSVAEHRMSQMQAQPNSLAEGLIYWFRQNLADPQRIRLIMQEALTDQAGDAAPARRAAYLDSQLAVVRSFQAKGLLRADLDPRYLLTLFLAITSFPACFPRIAGAALDANSSDALAALWEDCLSDIARLLAA